MKGSKNNLSRIKKNSLAIIIIALIVLLCLSYLFFKVGNAESKAEDESMPVIKISILNGCGIDDAAREVKEYLINKSNCNLDIISWKNADNDMFIYGKSIIVIKKYDEKKMDHLMKTTGIQRKIFALDANTIEEFQIILGKDYRKYFN